MQCERNNGGEKKNDMERRKIGNLFCAQFPQDQLLRFHFDQQQCLLVKRSFQTFIFNTFNIFINQLGSPKFYQSMTQIVESGRFIEFGFVFKK
jgi:hypothetical protein